MSLPDKYISIDEEGFPFFGELRVSDPLVGAEILRNIKFAENGAFSTSLKDEEYFVEAFDEPYVAEMVTMNDDEETTIWKIHLPYHVETQFDPHTLSLDEWDRFHGTTKNSVPFVFSRKAQAEFFNLLEEFDDESITIDEEVIELPPWLDSRKDVQNEKFWTDIYKNDEGKWELNEAAPALKDMLPRLKLPKSRILVLGCGSGNDAAHFAEQGHVVTAVDISPEALAQGKKKYPNHKITWVEGDLFKLPADDMHSFDVIFEHTCYCAIDPAKRNELVKTWLKLLAPGGHLLGVFFAMEKKQGPPFGGSEWELRERLKKSFQFIFWGRWHQSIDRRSGKELLVYAQKKS